MSDTLHMQFKQNIEVINPHVYLQDVASLSCSSSQILNRLRVMPVANLPPERAGRYAMSVMDIVREIQKKEPGLDISTLGEPDFILTYKREPSPGLFLRWCKILFVCLSTFFGAAFSIMTFSNDVDLPALFSQIYTQVTGSSGNGFTILEISYSIGIGLGVLFFFNHFGPLRLSDDPTPMEVKMRLYEKDVNTTILEDEDRKKEDGNPSIG
ncbi:MAG: stage V sporulation protein AA [Eubacteriales bacterium]|nr:stage V sporulation protein AA [Eubacteriales bacterium]